MWCVGVWSGNGLAIEGVCNSLAREQVEEVQGRAVLVLSVMDGRRVMGSGDRETRRMKEGKEVWKEV